MEILNLANSVISKFEEWGSDNLKDKISIFLNKIEPLAALEKNFELGKMLNELFSICLKCSFDLRNILSQIISKPFP